MPTYVLLTTYNADAVVDPQEMGKLDAMVKKQVSAECQGVEWIDSYLLLGRYDALDIFQAPDNTTASKAAVIIRSFGYAHTEVLPATKWSEFAAAVDQGQGATVVNTAEAEKAIKDKVDEAMVESFPASDPPSFSGS